MTTITTRYEASHGRKPRGTGLWAFEMTFTDGDGRYSVETVFASGSLSEAKRTAWSQLKKTVGGAKELIEAVVLP